MSFKKVEVVLLDKKQKGYKPYFFKKYNNKELIGEYKEGPNDKYHLYIISDDEIKEGDYIITPMNEIIQCAKVFKPIGKKIIATTDRSLTIDIIEGPPEFSCEGIRSELLPKPSQLFIQVFIEEYNKGNIITDVMVEYESYCNCKIENNVKQCNLSCCNYLPKINSKDNTITIRKIKDSWNRDEVEQLIKNAIDVTYEDLMEHNYYDDDEDHIVNKEAVDKWIKDNL